MKNLHQIKKIMLIGFVFFLSLSVHSQSLDSLLQLVTENNPTLKSLQLNFEAEQLKRDQVSQLPNLDIGAGIPVLRPETRLGSQVVLLSASQMFPWFGTLKSKENVIIEVSKAKYEMIAATRLELFSKVKIAYYRLNFIQQKQQIIVGYIEIYKSIESVALAKVESGQSTIADVLRIQLKLQEFEQELKQLENEKIIQSSVINELANLNWDNKITPTDKFPQLATLEYNLEEFKQKINDNHPLMNRLDAQIEASKQTQLSNANLNKPQFGLGVDYSVVQPRTDANPNGNGRDIFIPKVKVSIPLYRKSYKAKNQEEITRQEAYSFEKESISNKMVRMLQQEKMNYDNALLEHELILEQIKTIRMVYDILLSQYSSTGKGFDELLQIQNQLLNYELLLSQAQKKSFIAKANIEKLVDF